MKTYTDNHNDWTLVKESDSYQSKLQDPRWKAKKSSILERDGYRCAICGSTQNLEVHHRQYHIFTDTGAYREPWDYPEELLITLCHDCHLVGHSQYKVPVFFVER